MCVNKVNVQTFCPVGYSSNENIATDIVNVTFKLVVSIGLLCSFKRICVLHSAFFSSLSFFLFLSLSTQISTDECISILTATWCVCFFFFLFRMNLLENPIPLSNCVRYVLAFFCILPLLSFDCPTISHLDHVCVRNLWVQLLCSATWCSVPCRTIIAINRNQRLGHLMKQKNWKHNVYCFSCERDAVCILLLLS